jgi:uncharacterized protein YciI
MFYELAGDGLAKVPQHMQAHGERLAQFHSRGVLLMAGPYGNPPLGAVAVFTDAASAEEFARDDPFMLHGVVGKCTFQPWDEMFG